MPNIEPFDMFLGLVFAFVATMIYIGVRMTRENRETREKRAATQAEIGRRAAARGRGFAAGRNLASWKMHGTLASGREWTMAYSVGADTDPASASGLDWIEGQRLDWRCPALARDAHVFSFSKHTDKTITNEVAFNSDDEVWQRWRLESRDEAFARRCYTSTTCALLARLPRGIAWNVHTDERTSIVLGTDGLVAVLGVDELTADLVDLWIEICEALSTA